MCSRSMATALGVMCLATGALAGTVEFEFDSASFPVPANITNDYLPFEGGTLVFVGVAGDECEISKQTIGFAGPAQGGYSVPAMVNGVLVLVVRDQEWVTEAEDGECDFGTAELQEDTIDFYAEQDVDSEPGDRSSGSVWYLGEDTFSLPDEGEGPACSTEGAWRADGEAGGDVLAGILLLDDPRPGDRYRQEFDEDNAEDMAAVLRKNGKVSIDSGDTWNPARWKRSGIARTMTDFPVALGWWKS